MTYKKIIKNYYCMCLNIFIIIIFYFLIYKSKILAKYFVEFVFKK